MVHLCVIRIAEMILSLAGKLLNVVVYRLLSMFTRMEAAQRALSINTSTSQVFVSRE